MILILVMYYSGMSLMSNFRIIIILILVMYYSFMFLMCVLYVKLILLSALMFIEKAIKTSRQLHRWFIFNCAILWRCCAAAATILISFSIQRTVTASCVLTSRLWRVVANWCCSTRCSPNWNELVIKYV